VSLILLADDSAPAKNLGKKILEDAGYAVIACSNGLEAKRKMDETTPDLAIFDIFMPGYTGLELCQRLRGNPATAAVPVILTVGKLEPYRAEDGEQVHANAVLTKPFGDEELVAAVRRLIGAPTPDDRKGFTEARRSKPLLEWWDPAAEGIERSIAPAQQMRRGTPPSASTSAPAQPSDASSPRNTDEASADNGEEGDPAPFLVAHCSR